jgi:phenylacetate-CoA ligase
VDRPACASEIEAKLGIDAIDIYGLTEVMGPGVANECIETKDGPVIWEDHFYPEIIDPETGEVLPDGEPGRTGVHLADQGSLARSSATAPAT